MREFEDVIIIEVPTDSEINNFISLYNKTMEKNKAMEKYYFSFEFFKKIFDFGNLLINCNTKDNILASSAIILRGEKNLHYHLSATNFEIENTPTRAMLWNIINWGKEHNFNWLFLGGGRGSNDSLYQFKKGFSNFIIPYNRGEIIFNYEIYKKLTSMNPKSKSYNNYFPKYRVGIESII